MRLSKDPSAAKLRTDFCKRLTRLSGKSRIFEALPILVLLGVVMVLPRVQSQPAPTYSDLVSILTQRCIVCHSGESAPLGLRLDSFEAILKGSSNGPIVKSGDPEASELIRRIKGVSQPRMPLTGPPFLSDPEIAEFELWVAGGLNKGEAAAGVASPQITTARPGPGEPVTYQHIAPIFAKRCIKCHMDNGLMGSAPEGFRMVSYQSVLASNDRVRVVPGNPEASELVRRIRGQARPRMPHDGPPYLDNDEIQLITDWVSQGARDSAGKAAAIPVGAKVRLHGRLGRGWTLDGLNLNMSARTRVDKSPAPGNYVQVRGRLDASGKVNVTRLRRR